MIKSFHTNTVMLALLTILTGCSWFGKDEPEYLASREAESLKIPEGMDSPTGGRPVIIDVPEMRMPSGDELEPMPPKVVSTAGQHDTTTYMAWSPEGVYLKVEDTTDGFAGKLRGVIESSGMNLLEEDETGRYKFQYSHVPAKKKGFFRKIKFWRDGPVNHSGIYQTELRKEGEDTRVYLLYGDGSSCETSTAEHVLGIFMDQLG